MAKDSPEAVVSKLADAASPDDVPKVDRQFADKLARLEASGQASGEMIDRLRVMWSMLKADDSVVPWRSKALIMAALGYFVSPFDAIPDVAGKLGYMDDARVVAVVWGKIEAARQAFSGSE
jgi:uncharacterized membrane protein YkvA (DUF1232 family)